MVDLLFLGAARLRPVSVGVRYRTPAQRRSATTTAGNGPAFRPTTADATPE